MEEEEMFQSPSLRGSGRFAFALHTTEFKEFRFQSPSLRGSGRFDHLYRPPRRMAGAFQSPSLRGSGRFRRPRARSARPKPRFNPLHCGAVVASRGGAALALRRLGVSIPFIAGQWSLLVDAVGRWLDLVEFQSPSLRGSGRFQRAAQRALRAAQEFQSPSLRGSGRFSRRGRRSMRCSPTCFNPLHCGAVVASSPNAVRT